MNKKITGILLLFIALLLFCFFKYRRFILLNYTDWDLDIFLQLSSSWIDGRPFMYENVYGYNGNIHNNYLLLLLGPFIYLFGAYALFVAQTVLLIVSYTALLIKLFNRKINVILITGIILVLLLSPIWLWFNDDAPIGFHPELFYLPCSILFVLALNQNNKYVFVIAAIGVVLIKEDGAILGCLIHLTYFIMKSVSEKKEGLLLLLKHKAFWKIIFSWIGIFVGGMFLLSFKNHNWEPEPRLGKAFQLLYSEIFNKQFLIQHLILFSKMLLLLLPSSCILIYLLAQQKFIACCQILLIYCTGIILITILNIVEGSFYLKEPYFEKVSLVWPPRFVLVYSYTTAFILIYLLVNYQNAPSSRWIQLALFSILWLVQIPITYLSPRYYPSIEILLKETFQGRYSFNPSLINTADILAIKQIEKALPKRSDIFASMLIKPIFHQHYNVFLTGHHYKKAKIAIISKVDEGRVLDKIPLQKPYQRFSLETYFIYATPDYQQYIKPYIKYE